MSDPKKMTVAQIEDRIRRAERGVRTANFNGRYADARRHEQRAHALRLELEGRE